jgi:CarD family transcriptional regulator
MRREEDGAVMYVPEGKVQSIGLRKIASRDDVARMFTFLGEDTDKADLDWKQRKVANLDRMSQGGLKGLAEVVKGLQVLSELRPLPAKERELYDTARHLLVMEISASLAIAECDAEDSVDVALFPPGKDRPKRTAADFKATGSDEDGEGLDVSDDLLGLGGDLELPAEEAVDEGAAEEGEDAKPAKAKLSDDEVTLTGTAMPAFAEPKKRGRPPKAKTEVPSPVAGPPKKRGRPPKAAAAPPPEAPPPPPKPPPAAPPKAAAKPPPAAAKPPPPAPKPAPAAEPKKRGRPPKAAASKHAGKGAKKK